MDPAAVKEETLRPLKYMAQIQTATRLPNVSVRNVLIQMKSLLCAGRRSISG